MSRADSPARSATPDAGDQRNDGGLPRTSMLVSSPDYDSAHTRPSLLRAVSSIGGESGPETEEGDLAAPPAAGRPRLSSRFGDEAESSSSDEDDAPTASFVRAADIQTPLTLSVPDGIGIAASVASPQARPVLATSPSGLLLVDADDDDDDIATTVARATSGDSATGDLLAVPAPEKNRGRTSSICASSDGPDAAKRTTPAAAASHQDPMARRSQSPSMTGSDAAVSGSFGGARSPTGDAGARAAPPSSSGASSRPGRVPAPFAPTSASPAGQDQAAWHPAYSTMPRFGFPQSPLHHVAAAESAFLRGTAAQQQQATCEQQWAPALRGVQMLAHAVPSEVAPLRRICRKVGVPSHVRGIMWLTLSGVATRMEENEGFCAKLLAAHGDVRGDVATEIEKDLERTFPEHPFFAQDAPGFARLRRVLHALCWRNPILQYCQGFNFLAGLFLLFLDDEEATFWMACYVIEHLLPNDYFSSNLIGTRTDQAVLGDLIKVHLPKLHAHFAKAGFDPGVFVPTWVMSFFLNSMPAPSAVALWDYILTREPTPDPSPAPLAICLALFKLHSDALLGLSDTGEMLVELAQRVQTTCDGLKVVKIAHDFKLSPESVRGLRRKHRNRLAKEAADRAAAVRRIESAARITLQQREQRSNAPDFSGRDGQGVDPASPGRGARLAGSKARDSFAPSPFHGRPLRARGDSVARTVEVDAHSEGASSDDQDHGQEMATV